MKFTSMILAAGLLAAPVVAFAQTSPQTASSPGKESTQSPTEKMQPPGNVRAKPAADSTSTMRMKKSRHHMAKRRSHHMTTGSKPTAVPLNSTSGTGKKP
jgi:hypothetical protein